MTPMDEEKRTWRRRFQSSALAQGWLVLVLAVGFGAALAGVQAALGPVIERNKGQETLDRIPGLVLGASQAATLAEKNQHLSIVSRQVAVATRGGREKFYTVYEARHQGELKGWVVKTRGHGYADAIELLVGLSSDLETITGLYVLDQKETPGLGSKIVNESWRRQFVNAPGRRELVVVKTGAAQPGEIDGVTGATISSRSVTSMINTAIGDLRQPLTADPVVIQGNRTNG